MSFNGGQKHPEVFQSSPRRPSAVAKTFSPVFPILQQLLKEHQSPSIESSSVFMSCWKNSRILHSSLSLGSCWKNSRIFHSSLRRLSAVAGRTSESFGCLRCRSAVAGRILESFTPVYVVLQPSIHRSAAGCWRNTRVPRLSLSRLSYVAGRTVESFIQSSSPFDSCWKNIRVLRFSLRQPK